MSSFPDDMEKSPEHTFSELCIKLEDKFENMQDSSKGESLNVYARIRPMLASETEAEYKECVGLIDDQVVRAVAPASSSKFKMNSHIFQDIIEDFTFTAAYGPETGQFVFFQECMMNTMKIFIEGRNSLVFSYGTTGSGKTYTLQGNPDNPGIIPLSLHLFFASVEDQLLDKVFFKPDKFSGVIALNDNEIKKELDIKDQLLSSCNQEEWSFQNSSKSLGMLLCETFSDHFEGEGRQTTLGPEEMAQAQSAALMKDISKKSAEKQSGYCSIWVSFVEIYNENIYDLLQPNLNQRTKLNLGEDKNGDVYVKGLREVCVSNSQEALSLFNLGQRNLRIASTKLNYHSSRSHCIFTVKVIRIPDLENMSYAKVNRLSFCDLAGSERAAKSQTTGMRLKEAGCINTSLLVLGRCLEQLRLNPSQRDKKLIPFRESKLTRLFSGFFTGRGKAVMITNASPCELTFDETLHVLRFSAIAKELIINDSYITTAANTLQSITNMWTDVKSNCKNLTLSSNKSISFEDSMDEVLQEKDELIEKLLDLAESLKSNLEREKKEKAELEIKIRQDVCFEYAEFRDELMSMQKAGFEEERDAIREIYEKRIVAMEKRYQKIITNFQIQLEESFSSDDENSKDVSTVASSVNDMKLLEINTNASENEASENSDAVSKANETADLSIVSRKTEEELQKIVDYSLSLEVELECLRKKYEDAHLMLEETLKENDDSKKQLDAYKIDVLAFKTDNGTLLKDKLDLEADLKAFREDLVTVTQEKELLIQDLTDSKEKLCCLNTEINNLLKSINDLTREKEESITKYTKSLEESSLNNNQLKEQLLAVSKELETEKNEKQHLKSVILTMEKKICELQSTVQDDIQLNNVVENLSKENDELRNENSLLKKKLEVAEASVAAAKIARDEIEKVRAEHQEEMKKLNDSLKKHESDAKEAEDVLKSVNKVLGNSQEIIEKQKKEISLMEEECMSLKKDSSELQLVKKNIEEKLESLTANLELEKQKTSELAKELEKFSEQAVNFDALQADYLSCKNEITTLKKTHLALEEKLALILKESESEMKFQQLENEKKKLEEALSTISSQKDKIEELKCQNRTCLDELVELKKVKKVLEEESSSISSQNESEMKLKEHLESVSKKFSEAISTVNLQKDEIAVLKCENKKCLDKLLDLEKVKKDLEDKLKSITAQNESEMKLKEQLECESKKFSEAISTITLQKDEIAVLKCENKKCLDKLLELEKVKKDLEDKLKSITSQNGNVCQLVQVLENCEKEATVKVEKMQSNLEQLKEKFEASSINHEKELHILHELIEILEKCEVFASEEIKKFHSNSIKHVEQMMDLESSIKTKETIIEVLNKDINDLQKKYKDLKASSKKQQTEMQKLKSESEEMEKRLTNYKKLNESVKSEFAKLEAEKDKLENEYKSLTEKKEITKTIDEEKHYMKKKTPERKTSRQIQEETVSDEKSLEITALKEIKIHENKRRNRKAVEKSENVTENKKQKTEIYEEVEENSSNEITQQKKTGRRHLKCMSNVTDERDLIKGKNKNSPKSRTSKRKVDVSEYKSPEKNNLKKFKIHNVNEAENSHKPQNLRVMLLKSSANVNDIPLPSPRMTRGRKRLVMAKEITASPRTVRS